MHELSIAYNIVEIALAAANNAGVTQINTVNLRLGALAGVESESLRFGFEVAVKGTLLEQARLVIEDVPVRVYCAACATTAELPDLRRFLCPRCGAPTDQIISGRELELVALEYDDAPAREG